MVISRPWLAPAGHPGPEPLPLKTSLPGVFAVGDVRLNSAKRVAAAVGEGAMAVRDVHEYLASFTDDPTGRAAAGGHVGIREDDSARPLPET